jgi:hypothetical protein
MRHRILERRRRKIGSVFKLSCEEQAVWSAYMSAVKSRQETDGYCVILSTQSIITPLPLTLSSSLHIVSASQVDLRLSD